jgi:hypothetical protein
MRLPNRSHRQRAEFEGDSIERLVRGFGIGSNLGLMGLTVSWTDRVRSDEFL